MVRYIVPPTHASLCELGCPGGRRTWREVDSFRALARSSKEEEGEEVGAEEGDDEEEGEEDEDDDNAVRGSAGECNSLRRSNSFFVFGNVPITLRGVNTGVRIQV